MLTEGFEVIYEDNHLIAVNKEAGILVQGDKSGDKPLVELVREYLKKKYNKQGNVFCGVIHRIDRPVSGVVVLAKTSKGLERMNKVFHDRKIIKTYWALVKYRPPVEEGKLENWLLKDTEKNRTKAFNKQKKGALFAELNYWLLGKVNKYFIMKVQPLTGRPHQIRVQLAKIGCPILSDLKYGYHEKLKGEGIYLHAKEITFKHPIKQTPVRITARPPENLIWNDFKHFG